MKANILIIENDGFLTPHLCNRSAFKDYGVFETAQWNEARRVLRRNSIDVILLVLNSLKREGLSFLKMIKELRPYVEVIVINSPEQLGLSIEAMKLGAFGDFLTPLDLDSLSAKITEAVKKKKSAKKEKRSFLQKYQKMMVAVSFAEAGEVDSARELILKGSHFKGPGDTKHTNIRRKK